jgi:hypothetical protein
VKFLKTKMRIYMFWLKVKDLLVKTWSALKKLPVWAITALLILVATCWYLVGLVSKTRQVNDIRKKQISLEKDHHETLKNISEDEDEQRGLIEKEYREQVKELDEIRDDLLNKAAQGPVEIANAWKDYLNGKNK